jgi:hypothetical protein
MVAAARASWTIIEAGAMLPVIAGINVRHCPVCLQYGSDLCKAVSVLKVEWLVHIADG